MGVSPPVVCVLVMTLILLCLSAASAADCRDTNCLFQVRDECQTSTRVDCDLQHGPNGLSKQVNLTRTSFPRKARRIILHHTDVMTVEAGAIAELSDLQEIELTDIGTLILLKHSLQCDNHTGRMTVIIRRVKSLRLHPEAFSGCDIPLFKIEVVTDCQIDSFVLASGTITAMDLRRIDSLTIKGSAIGDTDIEKLSMKQIGSLSLAEGALANDTTVRELTIDSITHMVFSAGAIQANVSSLTVTNVNMSTCEEHSFGTAIQSLSLTFAHINLTRKGCISSPGQAQSLTVSNSTFNFIETMAIRGNIKQVHLKNSKFGRFAHQALNLTVTTFSIENSEVDDITGEALEVFAKQSILFRKCQINHLRAHGLYLLQVDADAIRIETVHIRHPERNSMQLHSHSTRIIPWQLELDVPCTCDALNDLNIHALTCKKHEFRENRGHWLNQTRCQANGAWPLLGHFIRESCPEPAATTPAVRSEQPISSTASTTDLLRGDQQNDSTPPSDLHAHGAEDQQTTSTAGTDVTLVIGLVVLALVIIIVVVALLVWRIKPWKRSRRRSCPSIELFELRDGSFERHISESSQGGLPDERDSRAPSSAAASGSYPMANLQHAPAHHAPGNRGVLVPHQPAATLDYDGCAAPAAYSDETAAGAAAAEVSSPTRSPPQSPWELVPLRGHAPPTWSSSGYVVLPKESPQSAGTSRASSAGRRRPHNDDWLLPGMPMNREKDPRIRELAYTRRT